MSSCGAFTTPSGAGFNGSFASGWPAGSEFTFLSSGAGAGVGSATAVVNPVDPTCAFVVLDYSEYEQIMTVVAAGGPTGFPTLDAPGAAQIGAAIAFLWAVAFSLYRLRRFVEEMS